MEATSFVKFNMRAVQLQSEQLKSLQKAQSQSSLTIKNSGKPAAGDTSNNLSLT